MTSRFANKEKSEYVPKYFDLHSYFSRFFHKREVSHAIMAETVAKTSKSNSNSVKEIFKTMSYGPAPEADNVAKVR